MRRRAWMLIVLLMGAAFLAGFLAADARPGLEPRSAAESSAGRVRPAQATDPRAPPSLSAAPADERPRRTADDGHDGPTADPEAGRDAAAGNVVVLEGLRPSSIRLRVVDADGGPVPNADVRVICAGGRAPRDDLDLPSVPTDAVGRATVRVPFEGRYGVIVRWGTLAAVREGVEATAREGGEVVVSLGRTAPFEVTLRGVPSGAPWKVVATAPAPTLADGTAVGPPLDCATTTDRETVALDLAEDVPFSLQVFPDGSDPRWRGLVPATSPVAAVSAPGTFVAEFRRGGSADDRPRDVRVEVDLRLEAETGALPPSGQVAYTIRERPGDAAPRATNGSVDWGPSDGTPSIEHVTSVWPPRTAGRIEWTVAGATGSLDVPPTPAGETLRLAATVRVPPSAVRTGVAAVEVLDEDGAPVPVGCHPETNADLFSAKDELGWTNDESVAFYVRDWLHERADEPVVAVRGLWRVSRPGTASQGESLRLRLELGGYLLVHVRKPVPRSLGALVVERVDGAWLGTLGSDALPGPAEGEDGFLLTAGGVQNGTLLGPLPPGDVGLRVLLDGVEVGRTTAHVVAGEVSVLTIR